ncbi:MAG: helix-turn-helix transcriptional regulator [Fibrobacterota bacterium]|nr:helix-turn-helix transcriptional regulator [Fibrobacterota bacterium]
MNKVLENFKSVLGNTRDSVEGIQQDLQFDIVQFIHEKLNEKKLNKSTLASMIKMKESQLSRILNAEVNLTIESIARIYWAFKCRPQIMERIEKKKSNLAVTSYDVAQGVTSPIKEVDWLVTTIASKV